MHLLQKIGSLASLLEGPVFLGVILINLMASLQAIKHRSLVTSEHLDRFTFILGLVSLPLLANALWKTSYGIYLETTFGGFFGPGTSPQQHFIPWIVMSLSPVIGVLFLVRPVRTIIPRLISVSIGYLFVPISASLFLDAS